MGSWPNDRCVHENVQWANCLTPCTFTCTRQTHRSLHVYMDLMCAYKRALIRLSNVFMYMGSEPCDGNVHEMWSEPSVWLYAHIHAHVRLSGHYTFTCTRCVHVIGQWSQWPMRAWKCAVSQLSDSVHIYLHKSDTCVTAHLHAPDVCM